MLPPTTTATAAGICSMDVVSTRGGWNPNSRSGERTFSPYRTPQTTTSGRPGRIITGGRVKCGGLSTSTFIPTNRRSSSTASSTNKPPYQ